ncbi:hypothetical protein L195_g058423 [Trifolium pratense]|uniref:Uncharacterized protein n=1 Tax=Trifolium pratense TaxID=57577 RepID=A0A2K3JS64_TRIPR|nr:hypothetical protein L195_g058423 [Trifolium pratense]
MMKYKPTNQDFRIIWQTFFDANGNGEFQLFLLALWRSTSYFPILPLSSSSAAGTDSPKRLWLVALDAAIKKRKRDTTRRVTERDAGGVVVVEYGIGMELMEARDGAWHDGVDGMSVAEKV